MLAASALAVMHPGLAPAQPGDDVPRRKPAKHADVQHDCSGGAGSQSGLFLACGELPLDLPVKFRLNTHLSQVGGSDFVAAARAAADTWNHPFGFGTPSPYEEAIEVLGTTTAGSGRDGINVVMWGNPADCGAAGAIAVACLRYESDSGAGAHRIVEVDIILNYDETWAFPSGIDEWVGVATGSAATATGSWLDVQSTLAHEFGHAVGLEHIGTAGFPFPSRAGDIGKHLQTMYLYDYRGSTAKRSLEAGDILGLHHIHERMN